MTESNSVQRTAAMMNSASFVPNVRIMAGVPAEASRPPQPSPAQRGRLERGARPGRCSCYYSREHGTMDAAECRREQHRQRQVDPRYHDVDFETAERARLDVVGSCREFLRGDGG